MNASESPKTGKTAPGQSEKLRTVLMAAVIAVLLAAAWFWYQNRDPYGVPRGETAVLLILPSLDRSADGSNEFLADALAVDLRRLINDLAPDRLQVIEDHSSRVHGAVLEDLRSTAIAYGADYILQSSLETVPDRVRWRASLLHAESRDVIWKETVGLPPAEFLDQLDELLMAVTGIVAEELLGMEEASALLQLPEDARDRLLFLRARHAASSGDPAQMTGAAAALRQLADEYPGFLEPRLTLAELFLLSPRDEARSQARELLSEVLDMAPDLPDALMLLAASQAEPDGDQAYATGVFSALSDAFPWNARGRAAWARLLAAQGRPGVAVIQIALARRLDPMSAALALEQATYLHLSGQYEAASRACQDAIRLQPDNALLSSCTLAPALASEQASALRPQLERWLTANGRSPAEIQQLDNAALPAWVDQQLLAMDSLPALIRLQALGRQQQGDDILSLLQTLGAQDPLQAALAVQTPELGFMAGQPAFADLKQRLLWSPNG